MPSVWERIDKAVPPTGWPAALAADWPTEPFVERALERKLRLRSGPDYVAMPLARVEAQLRAFLGRRLGGALEIRDLKPLTGGISKEQFSFVLERDGHAPERLVFRTQSPQSAAETDRQREYELIGALGPHLPVPEQRWIDAEGTEFDNPALICSFLPGVVRPPSDGPTDVQMSYGPHYRALLGRQFADLLGRVSALDVATLRLETFDVPPAGSNAGVISHINWWARVWEEDSVEPDPLFTFAAHWLRRHAPPIDRVSLTHGDYRAGNFLFDPENGRITALLDWELAWIGDRHLDLAYALQPLFVERDDGRDYLCGLIERDEFLDRFARSSGLPVDPDRLVYYEALVSWRNVAIAIGGGARCAIGRKTHQDVSYAWFVSAIAPTAMSTLRRTLETAMAHLETRTTEHQKIEEHS